MRCRWEPPYPNGGRRSTASSHLRASDVERNEVADRLSRHFADGRLDQIEFKARLDRAMGATTRGDLEGLFDDLPPLPTEATRQLLWHRRIVPVVAVVVLVAAAAGATLATVHVVRVPWVALAAIAAFVWLRSSRHRHAGPSAGADRGR